MTIHTPGVWSVAPSSNKGNGSGWRDLRGISGYDGGSMYLGEALEADAARIVRCVNAHDGLLAAADAVSMFDTYDGAWLALQGICPSIAQAIANEIHDLQDQCRAAIAKATGSAS